VGRALAQCGPQADKPYPPGTTTCPAGPGGGNAPAPGGAAPDGGGSTSCESPPCACALLGRIGTTTVAGTDTRSGVNLPVGEDLYGPFENGFGQQQENILAGLGCSAGRGHVAGGIDTLLAEQIVAQDCGVQLPRVEGNSYISLLDECGGHTREYHFHERLACLYTAGAGSGHSKAVGQGNDGRTLYGKWENFASNTLPKLDACGGHFGITPDSDGQVVYHYHVQDKAPFLFGCFGPKAHGEGKWKMLTLAECRALYTGCGNNDEVTLNTPTGSVQYDPWCPCYDADGSNVGSKELPIFAETESSWTCEGLSCAVSTPSTSTAATGSSAKLSGVFTAALSMMLLLNCFAQSEP